MTKKLQPCGTIGAYERHRYNNEPICFSCMSARKTYERIRQPRATQLRAIKKLPQTFSDKCGTEGGYRVHIRNFTTPCSPCVQSHEEFKIEQSNNKTIHISPFTNKACEEVWQNALLYFATTF